MEGIRYDSLFAVKDPQGGNNILFDLEPQRAYPSGYHLETRTQYYGANLLTLQKGITFTKQQYDLLYRVISIWVIMNSSKRDANKIYHYKLMEEHGHVNPRMNLTEYYMIHLGGEGEERKEGANRILNLASFNGYPL